MLPTNQYDVVIIGGGIHGVGVAQAAIAAGHSVLLLEQTALADGTSGRSSKLIHGGLRYLESAQFSLVRECLRERELLLKLAPDLVKLRRFYLPVYRHTTRRPWLVRAGLGLYALLGGIQESSRFRTISSRLWQTLDGLETSGLQTVFQYWDAQTDDAALTQAVMQSAIELGAVLAVPARFHSANLTNDGSEVHYECDGKENSCQARVLVNAAGPWVNHVLANIAPRQSPLAIDLVQGTHIVLEGKVTNGIYYLEAPRDKRAIFVMPWRDRVLVGTTETMFAKAPEQAEPLPEEIAYLLETVASYFPVYRDTTPDTIVSAFAGLRVLPAADNSTFKRARETVLHTDRTESPRVLSIYGGKLTAYRATARKVMQRLNTSLPSVTPVADTTQLPLRPA